MELEDKVNERLDELRKAIGLNISAFARKVGIKQPNMDRLLKGVNDPGWVMLKRVIDATGVSAEWLMKGEGAMFPESTISYDSNVKILGTTSEMQVANLPMIDAAACASYSDNIYQDLYKISSTKFFPVLVFPDVDYSKAYTLKIDGNSMYPTFKSGTVVLARLVAEGRWGQATGVHAVSTKEGMFTVKRIVKNVGNGLLLRADNPDYQEELAIQIADILCMFEVGETVWSPKE